MKVLLAYPNKLVGDGLSCLLSSAKGIESLWVCHDGGSVISETEANQPDVVAVSTSYFRGEKESYLKQISEAWPSAKILVISSTPSREEFLWTMESGVSGYITIESSGAQFVEAVEKVAAGEVVLFGVEQKIEEEADPERDLQAQRLSNLTPREKEILDLLSHGFSNRQIAENLFVSEHTVRTHVQNLRSKLNVRSKFQAAMLLMNSGTAVTNGMRL